LNSGNGCLLSSCLLSKNLKITTYKRIILPVVLYGHETWPLTLREEHRLRVTGEWRKLHNEKLRDLYSSPSIIRIIKSRRRWASHVAHMGENWNLYRLLVGKPEGK
jgi:hypothetical protein